MAHPSGDATRHLQRLATLVRQRRVALGFSSKEAAADACGISHTTYRKIEGTESADPQRVRDTTYAKLEASFGMRAGSCKAVLDGSADSVVLEDGTELIEGGKITPRDAEALEEGLREAITRGATLTAPHLTLGQVEAMNERIMEELRRRGLLPQATDQR
ncbi:hypothetical protein [Streptomyces sp. NPDC052015]|uniref:hypothetical protein n=1 Tax=Streptomyces sp. NPDC052015 TaxID=3154755 RepID=UPI0034177EBE